MRRIAPFFTLLVTLLLLIGCTTYQAKEAGKAMAGGLFEMALDVATGGPERRANQRRRWEDNPANRWSVCPTPCQLALEREQEARLEAHTERKRRVEAEELQQEFDEFMEELEESEQESADPPSVFTTNQ